MLYQSMYHLQLAAARCEAHDQGFGVDYPKSWLLGWIQNLNLGLEDPEPYKRSPEDRQACQDTTVPVTTAMMMLT